MTTPGLPRPTPVRSLLARSALGLLALAAPAFAGCAMPGERLLGYSDVQAINPGVTADWVLAEYPFGRVTKGAGGKVTEIRYKVNDPHGRSQSLVLHVGEDGRVRAKDYSGPVLKLRSSP